jgi:hypothetical protein
MIFDDSLPNIQSKNQHNHLLATIYSQTDEI